MIKGEPAGPRCFACEKPCARVYRTQRFEKHHTEQQTDRERVSRANAQRRLAQECTQAVRCISREGEGMQRRYNEK